MIEALETMSEIQERLTHVGLTVLMLHIPGTLPCEAMYPVVRALDKQYSEIQGAQFLSIDISGKLDLASNFDVQGIPTFVLFRNGERVNDILGDDPSALEAAVPAYLLSDEAVEEARIGGDSDDGHPEGDAEIVN